MTHEIYPKTLNISLLLVLTANTFVRDFICVTIWIVYNSHV